MVDAGHRQVWARLRIVPSIRFSRTRVLRLMRQHALFLPHRRPESEQAIHGGSIQTDHPNKMRDSDGIVIETIDEAWVRVFSAVDHFDACCVGMPVVRTGNRIAALQPIAQGLMAEFGTT